MFALDITDDANPRVLFEISDTDFPELGYVLGKPLIAPLKNGRWGVIFGNGDSSGSSSVETRSHLFVLDVFSPLTHTKILPTGSGKGLSAPAVLPDANGIAKAVYAGDLNGQLWKFDLSSTDSNEWDDKTYKLFHAKTADNPSKEQPITTAPTLGINRAKGGNIAVYFGTGKYFEEGDQAYSNSNPRHTFYAITDTGASEVDRDHLEEKTFDSARRVNEPAIDWSNKNGWYLDLGDSNGERVVAKALLIADRLVFNTLIPSASACEDGGVSWLLETAAVNPHGAYVVLKDPPEPEKLTQPPPGVGVTPDGELTILLGPSDGKPIDKEGNQPPGSTGRQSWRELD
jgi:type IV pilus assembly protein PilY1